MISEGLRPPTFPPLPDDRPLRRRFVYSKAIADLASQHTSSFDDRRNVSRRSRRSKDESLRLIDDLTNRSVDPLFLDSQLVIRPRSAMDVWLTRAVVFIICVAVGFFGTLMVKQLNTDPRKAVRNSLISELQQQNAAIEKTSAEVNALHSKVSKQYAQVSTHEGNPTYTKDDMINGTVPVTGPGITLTLDNPLSVGSQQGFSRANAQSKVRLVTDADLQTFIRLLWRSGAEAIAINGHRIGVGTSVRTAGSVILIGTDEISSPYTILAIGDKQQLSQDVGAKAQPEVYSALQASGIFPHIKQNRSLNLVAATTSELSYAQRRE